jgi:hypothetical protein
LKDHHKAHMKKLKHSRGGCLPAWLPSPSL